MQISCIHFSNCGKQTIATNSASKTIIVVTAIGITHKKQFFQCTAKIPDPERSSHNSEMKNVPVKFLSTFQIKNK